MYIAGKVGGEGGQFTKKINKYKSDRVCIDNKMHATPNSSENDESNDDFKQKKSYIKYQHISALSN